MISRETVTRKGLIPNTYLTDLYTDSLGEPPNGHIGESLGLRLAPFYNLNEYASSGENLGEIKVRFLAAFPDKKRNTIILGGGPNNTANPAAEKRTDAATMIADMSAMADAVIADGHYYLVILLHTPWMDHGEWTLALQAQTEEYNAAITAKYPNNVADIYTALGDPAEPRRLAPEFYKTSRLDIHPNKNAGRVIAQTISPLLDPTPNIDLSEPAGNLVANYRDFSGWSKSSCTLGGNTVVLPDGTLGSANGMVPSLDANANHTFQVNTSSAPAPNAACEMLGYIQAGEQDFLWSQVTDSNGATHSMFFNLVTLELGAAGGTGSGGVWTIEKSANGFTEIKLLYTNNALGGAVNNIVIRSADSLISNNTDPYNRTTDNYVPELFMDAVSLRVV